jgi:dihydroflavonol-4-reductase
MSFSEDRPWVLVTGAAGFVGTAFRRLACRSHDLVSLDCRQVRRVAPEEREQVIQADLGDPEAIARAWSELRFSTDRCAGIVHCAAYYDFANEKDERYARLEKGLEILLAQFSKSAPSDAVFVFTSSMAALKPGEPGVPLTPHSPSLGAWEYPASKIRSEAILNAFSGPQAVVQLVLAAVYSEWCELVPLHQLIELVATRPIERTFYPAASDRGFTYLHVEEAAEAILLALTHCTRGRHRLLIGEARPVTYRQIRSQTLSAVGVPSAWPLLRVPRWFARWGALVIALIDRLRKRERFLKPWMMAFAGEHFEFDLTQTQRSLGWVPRRWLLNELPTILGNRSAHFAQWRTLNKARPWRKGECGTLESVGPVATVVAAVIEREGCVLIARRLDGALKGMWEFPGGKREPGESDSEALQRELKEELGIESEIGEWVGDSEHIAARGLVELRFYFARALGEPALGPAHDALKWVKRSELPLYDLAPADLPIVKKLLEK